ncbi:hypothetical protein BO94DRAFT_542846 [Aspergillus sclerotioniger CBS 115572]|uniref:Xylanolytic transcriptional activator regulatory domain-containing protein n=1 Tax=Aspergillus sclerotioniger CBS 115572 TaxID=1450535 RepID=A0A317XDE8_9EURO|nr:hypothetical protein BO94DRAFT_542846 [Aspergillus sclerotioniger CBS 115572]PWY94560.1 hypothetical protein BO94DRAFT_542846 [Aspergillus sclerotioniger CBS 115572]
MTTNTIRQSAPTPGVPVSQTEAGMSIELFDVQRDLRVRTETGPRAAGALEGGLATREQQAPLSSEWTACVPLNRPIETDFIIPGNVGGFEHGLVCKAQEALRSALVHSSSGQQELRAFLQDERGIPMESVSLECLTWMLQDIGSAKFGSYVLDYFKHVAKSTLKQMCSRLLSNNVSNDERDGERDIFTFCTNAAAHKFLTTVLMVGGHDNDLTDYPRMRFSEYKKSAQAALDRIRLMTAPSLSLLQAILCGGFLHQGSGNTHYCYELTKAACRVATDLGMNLGNAGGSRNARAEEEIYCLLWCYMLDKNNAWKFDPTRSYFDPQSGVQDETSSLVKRLQLLSTLPQSARPMLHNSIDILLQKVEEVRQRIEKISLASPQCWKGVDAADEISALHFDNNSIRTTILYLSEQLQGQVLGSGELLLKSARQELSSLLSICLINEQHRAVGYLHWTLMYYPLTACFVLFCNAVMASNLEHLNLLKTVATVLMPSVSMSHPVAIIQRLVEDFVALSQPVFSNGSIGAGEVGQTSTLLQMPPSMLHHQPLPTNEAILTPAAPFWTEHTSTLLPPDLSETWTPDPTESQPGLLLDLSLDIPIPLDFDLAERVS